MNRGPLYINAATLDDAWAQAFTAITTKGTTEIAPLLVTFPVDGTLDSSAIQPLIDVELLQRGEFATRTVASTIFPLAFWNKAQPRARVYERYERAYPAIRRIKQNKYGTYFHRLTAFPTKNGQVNQLEQILASFASGNHRRSALQACVFDPARDHTKQRQRGFPCLQQVSFAPVNKNELQINGFYATEYVFEKAYGNYLGLRNLGRFIADALGVRLTRVNCYAGIALLGDSIKRSEARTLANKVHNTITSVAA